ncbi:MAG: hypothetical protein GY869_12125, partial [Planctomycetes bacterium]|nr:hypothetical protein [Planctomycetota bacterium]
MSASEKPGDQALGGEHPDLANGIMGSARLGAVARGGPGSKGEKQGEYAR